MTPQLSRWNVISLECCVAEDTESTGREEARKSVTVTNGVIHGSFFGNRCVGGNAVSC